MFIYSVPWSREKCCLGSLVLARPHPLGHGWKTLLCETWLYPEMSYGETDHRKTGASKFEAVVGIWY